MRSIPIEALDQAVADGSITTAQREAILRAAERSVPGARGRPPSEAPAGLNPVMVAYTVGALLVLFAFGWFLRDRWEDLGPPGIFAVATLFAAIFIGAARMLRSMEFPTAAGWTASLAVLMAPLAMWALLRMSGAWPDPASIPARDPVLQSWLWLTLELTAIAAALVALRFIAFPHLALEIAVAAALAAPSIAVIMHGADLGLRYMAEWVLLAVGSGLLAVGYATHRHGAEPEMPNWFYLVGLGCIAVGWMFGWGHHGWTRAALPFVALASLAAAVYLRRRAFFLFGILGVLGWLSYLAFDVFRDVASFPVVLATFGTVVILLTVLAQRRYPTVLALVDSRRGERSGTLPGDYLTALAPFALSLILLVVMPPIERRHASREAAELRRMNHAAQLRRNRDVQGAPRR